MLEQSLNGMRIAILGCKQVRASGDDRAESGAGGGGCSHDPVSNRDGQVHGVHHDDQKGDGFLVDLTFDRADPRDFDGVLLPGGVINADRIRMIPYAQTFVQNCDADDKLIAVICHGSWLLVSAKLVKDRTLTSWPSLRDDVENAGGT